MDRPTFYFLNHQNYPIRAGGLIYYRYTGRGLELLMIKNPRGYYEDFGGKSDSVDADEEEMVIREAMEESNNQFAGVLTKEDLRNGTRAYSNNRKYILYLLPTPLYFESSQFGVYEEHTLQKRTVEWVTEEMWDKLLEHKVEGYKIHPRLFFKRFFTELTALRNDGC